MYVNAAFHTETLEPPLPAKYILLLLPRLSSVTLTSPIRPLLFIFFFLQAEALHVPSPVQKVLPSSHLMKPVSKLQMPLTS